MTFFATANGVRAAEVVEPYFRQALEELRLRLPQETRRIPQVDGLYKALDNALAQAEEVRELFSEGGPNELEYYIPADNTN